MEFSGSPKNISNTYSAPVWVGSSTNTTRVHAFHALVLPSKHY